MNKTLVPMMLVSKEACKRKRKTARKTEPCKKHNKQRNTSKTQRNTKYTEAKKRKREEATKHRNTEMWEGKK